MTEVIPRWEWRTFGADFGEAEARIAAGEQTRAVDSGEVYILSRRSGVNVKIREAVLNVKVLLQTNGELLEQWTPALKALLPLDAETVAEVMQLLRVPPPRSLSGPHSLERLLKLAASGADLLPVHVTKQRTCHSVNGCKAEIADLTVDGIPIRTVAVEHESPKLVTLTVHMLGLEGRENVNYVRGLKRLMGWEA
ncbi:MAG: hypothetical protein MUE60_08335 [Candidatus Eisenbacteria bacterium]|jgi:exopolyphosphatase/guanosine-5'-triphosphate,3'-diphosphate pyrophosphatase|nr:hypothetical protein [Candidatus Eisenbacteria bacterium]